MKILKKKTILDKNSNTKMFIEWQQHEDNSIVKVIYRPFMTISSVTEEEKKQLLDDLIQKKKFEASGLAGQILTEN